jgi:hypothetical protein
VISREKAKLVSCRWGHILFGPPDWALVVLM